VTRIASLVGVCALVVALTLTSRITPELRWEWLGQLAHPRALATTLPLPNGEVLVVGGIDNDDPALTNKTAELIDPYNGKTTVLPDKLAGRVNHTATLTGSSVIVTGGTERTGGQWTAIAQVDRYDMTLRTWKTVSAMTFPRSDHGATTLRDGRVLVAGGTDGPRQLESVEIYDPARNTWTVAAAMPEPRSQFSIATLRDGLVFIAGGLVRGLPSSSTLLYDPVSSRWEFGPRMDSARVLHTAVALANGDVLIIGGQRDGAASAERFDWRARKFVPAGFLTKPRMLGSAVQLPDNRVLVVGGLLIGPGREGFAPMGEAEIWDPLLNEWSDVKEPATSRALGSLVITHMGALWIGGAGAGEHATNAIERFTWR